MWNLKKTNKVVKKQKRSRLTDIENKLVVTTWGGGQYRDREVGGTNHWV